MVATVRDSLTHITQTYGPSFYFGSLPPEGKICEIARRVATAVVCVFAYIALGLTEIVYCLSKLLGKKVTPVTEVDHKRRFESSKNYFLSYISAGNKPITSASIFVSNGTSSKEFSVNSGDIASQIGQATDEIKSGAKELPFQWYALVKFEDSKIATFRLSQDKDGNESNGSQFWDTEVQAIEDFREKITRFTQAV